MIIIKEKHTWRGHAANVVELATWLENTPYTWKQGTPHEPESAYHGKNWVLRASWDDCINMLKTGWEEGVKQISDTLAVHSTARRPHWRNDVAGDFPDVPRFLGGAHDPMRRRGHDNRRRPIVSIMVNNWINAAVDANHMVNFGAAMVAWIDRIEASGKRVELIAGTVAPQARGRDIHMSATWTVKQAEDPLDLSALAFSLAHPGASRRIGWGVWGRSGMRDDSSGMGVAVDWDVDPERHLIDPEPGTLVIRGANGQFGSNNRIRTYEEALKEVARQINAACARQGVEDIAVELEDVV